MIRIAQDPSRTQEAAHSRNSSSAHDGSRFAKMFHTYADAPQSMDEMFSSASAAYNVPEMLLKAIGFHESAYQADAISSAGAMGIMQLMPATVQTMGVRDPYDPAQNIMGGAKLLSQYLQKYGGDLKLTLAAYGAGSGSVAKYDGVPPFEETQNFVSDIMAALGKNFTASGYDKSISQDMSAFQQMYNQILSYSGFTQADYSAYLNSLLDDEDEQKKNQRPEYPVVWL